VTTGVGGGQSKPHGIVVWSSPFLKAVGTVLWIRLLVAGLWPWMSGFKSQFSPYGIWELVFF